MNKLSKENLTIASKHLFNTTNIDKKSEYMHVLFSYGRKSFLGHDTYERQTKMLVKKSVKMGHLKSLGSEKSRVVHQNNLSVLMFYKDKLVSGSEQQSLEQFIKLHCKDLPPEVSSIEFCFIFMETF